ncbi:MAG: hypothetical protein Q9217_003434 [Psora testacea]
MPVNDPVRRVYEPPLARHAPSPTSLAFDQCATVFAIDISGSTEGLILEEEKDAVETDVASLASLKSKSGGTYPIVLLESDESRKALQTSDLWFLLTDGLIAEKDVQAFAEKITTHGLHSKACVLIVFGYRPSRPIECNISVGIPVFAMTPDAIFLFHDADTHELLLFQTKGCFSNICGKTNQTIVLNADTTWSDLPVVAYDQFFSIRVPPAQYLQKNSIFLQDRTEINLDDLSHGTLSEESKKAVLNNDENLKSVLLTMSTQGRNAQAKNWVGQQRLKNNAAGECLKKVIVALREHSATKTIIKLQQDLRQAHSTNWERLSESISICKREAIKQNAVLDDAMERLSLYDESGPSSPLFLSPVGAPMIQERVDEEFCTPGSAHGLHPSQYSPSSRLESPDMVWSDENDDSDSSDEADVYSPSGSRRSFRRTNSPNLPIYRGVSSNKTTSRKQKGRRGKLWQRITGQNEEARPPEFSSRKATPPDIASLMNETTFIPGFHNTRGSGESVGFKCQICGEVSHQPTLLLRKPPLGENTPGFPLPMSCSEIAFPLALAAFRETDIVAKLTCCSTCAYYIAKNGMSLYDEEIRAALPITPALFLRENKHSWSNIVDDFFEGRFERRNLLPIMLGILTDAQHRAARDRSSDNSTIENVLAQACEQVREECRISYVSGRLGTLDEALSFYLRQNTLDFRNELFDHPLESFALLVSGAITKHHKLVSSAIFMRTILYMFNLYVENRSSSLGKRPSEYLRKLKEKRSMNTTSEHDSKPGRNTVSMELLISSGLIEPTALLPFEGLQPIWSELQGKAESAFYICLLRLAYENTKFTDPRPLLERWRTRGGLSEVFADPISIHGGMINSLLVASP